MCFGTIEDNLFIYFVPEQCEVILGRLHAASSFAKAA